MFKKSKNISLALHRCRLKISIHKERNSFSSNKLFLCKLNYLKSLKILINYLKIFFAILVDSRRFGGPPPSTFLRFFESNSWFNNMVINSRTVFFASRLDRIVLDLRNFKYSMFSKNMSRRSLWRAYFYAMSSGFHCNPSVYSKRIVQLEIDKVSINR